MDELHRMVIISGNSSQMGISPTTNIIIFCVIKIWKCDVYFGFFYHDSSKLIPSESELEPELSEMENPKNEDAVKLLREHPSVLR
jgi:hypothetical protein